MVNDWLRRTLTFTRFTLREYSRSGRVLIEVVAMVIVAWLFFWPNGAVKGLDPYWFFSMANLFFLCLSAYTTFSIMRLGNRPQGYVVLSRDLGRSGYLAGLYIAAGVVVVAIYLLFNLEIQLIWWSRPHTLSLGGWILGTVPLLLNSAIMGSLTTFLAPLVMPQKPRLLVLGLIVLMFSRNVTDLLHRSVNGVLWTLQAALGLPLLPALAGFDLSAQRAYSLAAPGILLAQLMMAAALFAGALFAFDRRELILK